MSVATTAVKRNFAQSLVQVKPLLMNLMLITLGSVIFAYGMNAVMIPARLFSGGLGGVAVLIKYHIPSVNIGLLYLLFNIPMIMLGWISISKRFIAYTLFGILVFSMAVALVQPPAIELQDTLLASLLAGVICGLGNGLILRSIGSAGGLDILAVFLNKRYSLRIGKTCFTANAAVILGGIYFHDFRLALYSIILLYTSGSVINMVMSGFNARMSVMIISDQSETIAQGILHRLDGGVTFLDGQGAFTHNAKRIILTITTLTELPKLKEMVFACDPQAFVVINNTFEVLGQRHGNWRIY